MNFSILKIKTPSEKGGVMYKVFHSDKDSWNFNSGIVSINEYNSGGKPAVSFYGHSGSEYAFFLEEESDKHTWWGKVFDNILSIESVDMINYGQFKKEFKGEIHGPEH